MDKMNQTSSKSPALQDQLQELRERAAKDALSGLLNRLTAEQTIKQRLVHMGPDDLCAMMIIDLDNFKQINDTLGHLAGDQAIRQAGQVLTEIFNADAVVGRLGGDEFIVFLSGQLTEEYIREKSAEICQQLQFTLSNTPGILLTVSVGVRIASGSNLRFENMYQSADLAMYKAKKRGKHGYYIKRDEDARGGEFQPVNTIPLAGLLEHMESGLALLEIGQPIRMIYASASLFRIIGMDAELCPLPCLLERIIHPNDVADLERILRKGAETNQVVNHTHRVSPDGKSWMWWHIRAYCIDYDNPNPVMLVTTVDVSEFKKRELQLQEDNQRLQTAFDQTTQNLWEVDMDTQTFTMFNRQDTARFAHMVQMRFPDDLLSEGWVHPDSASRFQNFSQSLLQGQLRGDGNFVVQGQDTGRYGWAALSYRMVCSHEGKPIKAIGILEYLPQGFTNMEEKASLVRPLPRVLEPYLILGLRANLTRDTVHNLWREGKNCLSQRGSLACSRILHQEARRLFSVDDQHNLGDYFQRDRLLELFAKGERWVRLEYRRVDEEGNIRWVRGIINMMALPKSQDVVLFLYLLANDRRRWEQELESNVGREASIGLYEAQTAQALIEARMRKATDSEYALAVLQMGGQAWLWEQSGVGGHPNGYYVAAALSVALGPVCILGLHGQGQLLAFFPEIHAWEEVKKSLEEAFAFVRFVLADILALGQVRFVAGVVCSKAGQVCFDDMAGRGGQLCQMWEDAPTDTVMFAQDDEAWGQDVLRQVETDDRIVIHQSEMERPLSEGEKDVALRCVSAMLAAQSLDSSICSVLSYIGAYYQADRVYILTLAEQYRVATMPYEWTTPQKRSVQQAASGLLLERFPILKRCLEERAPVFLTKLYRSDVNGGIVMPWHYTALPLIEEGDVIGLLCIENAHAHSEDAALFSILLPHIVREQKRFLPGSKCPASRPPAF